MKPKSSPNKGSVLPSTKFGFLPQPEKPAGVKYPRFGFFPILEHMDEYRDMAIERAEEASWRLACEAPQGKSTLGSERE